MFRETFYFLRRSCFLMMSNRLFLVTSTSSGPCLAFCLSLRCCSWRWGEFRSWGGRMEPVGLTLFTTSRNSRLLLLLRNVMAVPLCPSRPDLPTWMGRNEGKNKVICLIKIYEFLYNKLNSGWKMGFDNFYSLLIYDYQWMQLHHWNFSSLYTTNLMDILIHRVWHVKVHYQSDVDEVQSST